jgi:hypothetical protein
MFILEARLEIGVRPMPSDWIKDKAQQENKLHAEILAREEKQKRDSELVKSSRSTS